MDAVLCQGGVGAPARQGAQCVCTWRPCGRDGERSGAGRDQRDNLLGLEGARQEERNTEGA